MTTPYDKPDDFSFRIAHFSLIYGNIPSAPAFGVFISQLKRYTRACRNYADYFYRAKILTIRLLKQGYFATRLKSSLYKFYGRHHELVGGSLRCIHLQHETYLFSVIIFSFPVSFTPDLPFSEQLDECFLKNRGRLPYRRTLSMLQVLCTFYTLYVSF